MIGGELIMKKIVYIIESIEDWLSGLLIISGLSVLILQVVLRYIFEMPTTWQDEIARYFIIWGVLIGASVALRDNTHIRVEIFYQLFSESKQKWINLFANLVALSFFVFLVIYGFQIVEQKWMTGQRSSSNFPLWLAYSILPLSGIILTLRTLIKIYNYKEDGKEEQETLI